MPPPPMPARPTPPSPLRRPRRPTRPGGRLLLAGALALAGCASLAPVPPSPPPPTAVPARLDNAAIQAPAPDGAAPARAPTPPPGDATAPPLQPLDRHTLLQEPRLRALVELALAQNRELAIASHQIDAARAAAALRGATRSPALDLGLGGSAALGVADGQRSGSSRQLSATLGTSAWEIDLWGRLARLEDAARAELLASTATRRSLQTGLVADVAAAWLGLAADQQRLRLTELTLASRRQSLDLAQTRERLGAASPLDTAAARAAVETARGDLARLRTQAAQSRHALQRLVGTEPPAALLPTGTDAPLQGDTRAAVALQEVPAGLPASVLLQRPDLQAAAQTLAARRADLAAARAARLPTLSLTARAGVASRSLGQLLGGGGLGLWSLLPELSLPLLDGGRRDAAEAQADAQAAAELARYDATLQTAFREVADTLAEREHLAERLAAQQAQVEAYVQTLALSQQRQRAGAESPLAVLDAQRQLWTAQQDLLTLRLAEQANRLTLYKVLGGA